MPLKTVLYDKVSLSKEGTPDLQTALSSTLQLNTHYSIMTKSHKTEVLFKFMQSREQCEIRMLLAYFVFSF